MPERERFDAEEAMSPLKNFQRRTVDYVFRRLYEGDDGTKRFLVADEVGLGKTMVARGVIARAIEHLWESVDRIDIVYVCSNQAIASQNINRLNVLGKRAISLPTRMTLLPLQQFGELGLDASKVNFFSLTPGTTFDLRSSTGLALERAFLFHLLADTAAPRAALKNLLQVRASRGRFNKKICNIQSSKIPRRLIDTFRDKCEEQGLVEQLVKHCRGFRHRQEHYQFELVRVRNRIVARLRGCLAHVCVDMLEPDLIILDEFQRFTDLLHGDHEAARLARELFDYTDGDGNDARTLLLSATPYRMLTLSSDTKGKGNHYQEFLNVLKFLYGSESGPKIAEELAEETERFRRSLLSLPSSREEAQRQRSIVEGRLKAVMARTERIASTRNRDAMVEEPPLAVRIEPKDLRAAASIAHVARIAGAPSTVEYWKSAPYLMNFMRDYVLKRKLRESVREGTSAELLGAIESVRPSCLDRGHINSYRPLSPPNSRMRVPVDDLFAEGLERQLWIPPSLPYYGDAGVSPARSTKALLFSSWSMVPDAVAAVVSYEAERRMGMEQAGLHYFDTKHLRAIHFREQQGRLAGLRALNLIYPSPLIARVADPLEVVAAHHEPISYDAMRNALADRLRPHLERLQSSGNQAAELSTWEWASPVVLDSLAENRGGEWLGADGGFIKLGDEKAWPDHVKALQASFRDKRVDGAVPDRCLDLLVDLALGSPAICALRALHRIAPQLEWDDPTLLTKAAHIAWGFRTLYNLNESVALLRQESTDHYWHAALTYAARHDLQAVLDEYIHWLVESEGLVTKAPDVRASGVAHAVRHALSLRPSHIDVDDPQVDNGSLRIGRFRMRGRFAMRLADYRDEEGATARLSSVRDAFNSPFRPFVLATTSIGQEGLDFHPYCHRVYHWNLPGNPVDLEQREGRVHRYKGHAIRLNVADRHASAVRGRDKAPADPWAAMFAAAREATESDDGIVPYWIYEGNVKVERRVPLLPYSREINQLKWLKESVAVYRLAFGQPRQDDLLAYLRDIRGDLTPEDLDALQIRLQPGPTE